MMASGLNRVMLLGDIASEPEVYVTRSGMVVMSLRLATTETYLDKDDIRRERTSYHPIVLFGRRADTLSKILHRGARVFVEGSLRTSTFESRDGKKWNKTEIVANEILFAGERSEPAAIEPLLTGT
ncbi:Single-stranded DNA-binding protein [Minicystis rosea]|nr:Single-stranded DNA-binding protein [Minicystis rosea]